MREWGATRLILFTRQNRLMLAALRRERHVF